MKTLLLVALYRVGQKSVLFIVFIILQDSHKRHDYLFIKNSKPMNDSWFRVAAQVAFSDSFQEMLHMEIPTFFMSDSLMPFRWVTALLA